MARRQLEVSNEVAAELAGSRDAALRTLEEHLDCEVFLRGNIVTLDGEAEAVQAGATVVRELSALVERGHDIGPATIESVARVLESSESPSQVLEDVVWRHRNLRVTPKSVNQKRYVDAIRRSTVTFGVGPAGTGKTFLAMAMATAALARREVNRIILTRPAVEAGERLGFLPGDLMAKVDPYLRPLFDALHDMMEAERVAAHLEKGVIEVAPLAFMRGRTLNDSFVILDEAQNTSPERWSRSRSICVTSPVTTIFELNPSRVRNILICSGVVFCASSRMMKLSFSVRPRMKASGATSTVPRSIRLFALSGSIMS